MASRVYLCFQIIRSPRAANGARPKKHSLNSVNCVKLFILTVAFLNPNHALARDSLGVFESWGAFRDPKVPRCYAIAMAEPSTRRRETQPYASVGIWPRRNVRGQVHFRLARRLGPNARVSLALGRQRFALTGGGFDAWAPDVATDAAITAAMRSAPRMTVNARDAAGRPFSSRWQLSGAATAMDAAAIGCARQR